MKIAYLILAHTDPSQLGNLVKSLYVAQSTLFFIHVDAKQNVSLFEKCCSNIPGITFIANRVSINWGGYSLCIAEQELLKESLKAKPSCDRFILLSGLDYPLWSNEKLLTEFQKNPKRLYLKAYNLSKVENPQNITQRIQTYHFRDLPIANETLHRWIVGGLMRIMNVFPIKKKKTLFFNNTEWCIWGGGQWFNISRDCASFLLSVMENNKKLCSYFKTSLAPDELMIQTIIFNSSYRKHAEAFEEDGVYPGLEATTYTHYIEYKGGQRVFTEQDFDKLISSGKMF